MVPSRHRARDLGRAVGHAHVARRCSSPQGGAASRAAHRGDGPAPGRRGDHGDRVDQESEGDHLRRRRLDPQRTGVDRDQRTRNAGRHLRRGGEEQGPPLEYVRRRLDAEHAAHHLERYRAARRPAARISRVARLCAHALWFRRKAVRQDTHEHAYHHLAERRGAGGVFPSGSVRAECGGPRGCAGARRKARPRGGRSCQDVQTGEEEGRSEGRDGSRCASWNRRPPGPRPSSRPPRNASPLPRQTRPRPGPRTSSRRQPQGPRSCAAQLEAAQGAARDAKLALVPVSVFISRATQKLYVRRNTQERLPDAGELFDTIEVPVTIRNPGQPIGTHVITAVASADGGLRWTAVTVDGASDAKDALDRITIPQEVIDRFGPTALPRSSIIISDEPLHRETNYRTEFVVALNNQPRAASSAPAHAARNPGCRRRQRRLLRLLWPARPAI